MVHIRFHHLTIKVKRREVAQERRNNAKARVKEYAAHPERKRLDSVNMKFERGSAAWDRVVALVRKKKRKQ